MDDNTPNPPAAAPAANMTHASVTGKVPVVLPHKGAKRKGKPVKLSSDGNRHFKQLSKRGMISPKAAAASGIKGATK